VTGNSDATRPVRGTQQMVDHMGWVFRRPHLALIEIAWRWIFGIPFLLVCLWQARRIAAALPPSAAGAAHLNSTDPWIYAVQLGGVWDNYLPFVLHVLTWLVPVGIVAWAALAGLGRGLLFRRMEPEARFRPLSLALLQAGWAVLLCAVFLVWYQSIQWVAATHISPEGADLVGYCVWAIFLSLGFFVFWALASWPLVVAPVLVLREGRSALSALAQSFRLGPAFTGKLIEINLTMGIVKLMLIVLAMVFSAAPLPFAAQLGSGALHLAVVLSLIFYCVASDYFQVVRLKAFLEFWYIFRGQPAVEPHRRTSAV